ncbi:MAG: DUF1971 domain-containing protein [Myxococcota bacterium]
MEPYKTLRFGPGEIPDGLLREHNLRAGVRGVLRVLSGTLVFVMGEERRSLAEGDTFNIAPEVVHHLEEAGGASIEIQFFRSR